jgi:hypothetical protein
MATYSATVIYQVHKKEIVEADSLEQARQAFFNEEGAVVHTDDEYQFDVEEVEKVY